MAELLTIDKLHLWLASDDGPRHILRGISLSLAAGGFYGLIGESGSGKTMTARTVLGMLDPERSFAAGSVCLDGTELLTLDRRERRRMNGRAVSYVSQDPMTALNPLFTAGEQVAELLRALKGLSRPAAKAAAITALADVGLPAELYSRYPHELSGGQLQRVCIAMAICTEPKLLIADEPTTALDVTTQAQILALLRRLRKEKGLCILLITHDFGVVAETCDDVFVIQEGQIVERGPLAEVFTDPQHPGTRRLIDSARRRASYDASGEEARP